jgi:hypothetical protein
MLQPTASLLSPVLARDTLPRTAVAIHAPRWILALWRAARRHAERADRVVPYY